MGVRQRQVASGVQVSTTGRGCIEGWDEQVATYHYTA